eukprot:TRINITY_DN3795_c0_g1_i19.p1 TRINITY_DN3795_c0_g1~~TRINITY_DN3795_c0_g1_i19.p1  ORF type:complete len:842 (-),score=152.99 TRINITY_DN3795_c0_g1_i19:108-2633(-)
MAPKVWLLLLMASGTAGTPDLAQIRREYHWPSGTEAIGSEDASQSCAVSQLAYEYGLQLQPHRAPLLELFDALQLHTTCGLPRPTKPSTPPFVLARAPPPGGLFVHPELGHDGATGTEQDPLRTVTSAIERVVASGNSTIVLRGGLHFLNETLELGPLHSGLTIMNYPGEVPWLSGGVRVDDVAWESVGGGVFKAKLEQVHTMPGLNTDNRTDPLHARMIRARFPNRQVSSGSMERGLVPGNVNTSWIKPIGWAKPGFNLSRTVTVADPGEGGHAGGDFHWTYGVGGWSCGRYTPAGGFWCANNSNGGGSGWELMVPGAPLFPIGMTVGNKVFDQTAPWPCAWRNKTGAVVETWTNGWSTTFWEVVGVREEGGNCTLMFGDGGQQTGRGFHVDPPNPGGHGDINTEGGWKIENAIELLDAPEEFFWDEAEQTVYLVHNSSDGADKPRADGWIVPTLKQLVRVVGESSDRPVQGISIQGVGFRDSAYTYMDEWGIPSGGDWALHRGGALFVQAAEKITIEHSQFTLLDGNAIFLSGYTRNVTIANCSFSFIGDNAMAAWGYTHGDAKLPTGVGINGTSGDQPRFSSILSNIVREIGMNERQSSAWSEAKACLSHVKNNIFFNMPRAAINKNDGFGGGTVVEENLLTNTCRESGDHGNFNSWDRQPFLTEVRNGTPSLIPAYYEIRNNFMISNYGAGFGVDNDDTSSYYLIHNNFFYLGGGVKCDYDGHDKRFYNNLMLGTTAGCWHTCAYKKGYPDYCYNNTIIQATNPDPPPGQPKVSPFAIIWFCDARNVSHVLPDYNNQVQMGEYIYDNTCLLYTSDAADEEDSVDLGGRRIIKKKKKI